MACTDRQLQQSQITQGFSTRNGVQQAIRPFTGEPSGSNLMDYLNRELFPVVKAMRSKVNEVYLPAKENASSANPLSYYFSESTVNADPTLGRVRLNQAVQNTATVLRVSETNGHRKNVSTWLSVMQGGSTTPLGVVTLSDAADPGRFIRFNMSALVDNGAYWDLTVTPVESSHPNPFVEGEAVLVSYIAGVASGGVSLATNVAAIRGVSAGTQLLTSGTLRFSNSNNVSFGLSNSSVLTASYAFNVSGGTSSAGLSNLVFANDQNVSWGLSGSTITANASQRYFGLPGAVDGAAFSFNNVAGLTWSVSSFTFVNGAKTQTGAQYTPTLGAFLTTESQLGLVSHIGGNAVSSVTRLAFSNASNVTWSLSTAANAATVIASVAAGGGGMGISAGTQSVNTGTMVFSNSNLISFGMSGSSRVTASFAAIYALAAGSQNANNGSIVFADSNNVTFGMSGFSQVTASFGLRASAGASSADVSNLVFTNTNNVGFALSTNAAGATVRAAASISVSAGTTNVAASQLSFANSNGVTWGLNGSTVTASVAAAAGGGVALSDTFGNVITSGTAFLSQQTNSTLSNLFSAVAFSNNVMFGITGQSVTAQAHMRFADATGGNGNAATRMNMVNSNGLRWGTFTTESVAGAREFNFTGTVDYSVIAPAIPFYMNNGVGSGFVGINTTASLWVTPFLNPMPGRITADTFEMLIQGAGATGTPGSYGFTLRGGLYSLNNSTQLTLINSFSTTASSTSQSSTAWNNRLAGDRYLTLGTGRWSSSPVFSAGVQYWIGMVQATAGTAAIGAWYGAKFFGIGGSGFRGDFNVSNAAASSFGFMPFDGVVNTTAVPVSIGTAAIAGDAVRSGALPVFNLRQGIARGA